MMQVGDLTPQDLIQLQNDAFASIYMAPWRFFPVLRKQGVLGLFLAGLFACTAVNPAGANGLFFGNPAQLGIQCLVIGVTIVYTFVVTYILFKVIDKFFGLRVSVEEEINGLDLSQHNETAYNM